MLVVLSGLRRIRWLDLRKGIVQYISQKPPVAAVWLISVTPVPGELSGWAVRGKITLD
jgi:hypothetical protein